MAGKKESEAPASTPDVKRADGEGDATTTESAAATAKGAEPPAKDDAKAAAAPQSPPADAHAHADASHGHGGTLSSLVVGAIGIVFGDIGTSPLYTLKECVMPEHGINPADSARLLGVMSLIFWSITFVVTIKYLTFVMQADNRGEGGILALLALLPERLRAGKKSISVIALLVIAGAALLYGDGMITPAISVLSAVEGLEVATPLLKGETDIIVGITCAILVGLFAIQRFGTEGIGKFFGPVMVVWFITLAGLGIVQIAKYPAVFAAVDPRHAIGFLMHDPRHSFMLLGSVVLAVTGGEALYADMGHFGAKAIRIGWLVLAMPALLLNYFGQTAMLLQHPDLRDSPFYAMAPGGIATYLLVGLATLATIIASQALISGAFSLTHQAVQLGFFPRVMVKHTSKDAEGQIYIPQINWLLGIACIALVIAFRESSKLAAAYGIAVTGTMAITSVVYYTVARQTWGWSVAKALPLLVLFLAFDIPFFVANAAKFFKGGFVPVIIGAFFFTAMVIWRRGRRILAEHIAKRATPLDDFIAKIDINAPTRLPGAAVFMCSSSAGTPPVLLQCASKLGVLHERVVLLTIMFDHSPTVDAEHRAKVTELGNGFVRVIASYGFMEEPNVPSLLMSVLPEGDHASFTLDSDKSERVLGSSTGYRTSINMGRAVYFVGRETFLATGKGQMGALEESIFAYLSRNSATATAYFSIPPERVVELGSQIDL
jgi:KUP system potassium uptake protein